MSQGFHDVQQDPVRQRILKALGLDCFLDNRSCIYLGDIPIHCELYLSQPEYPVVIFIPGIGTYSEMYCEFLYRFSLHGFNLVSVDLRGHGYSGGSRGDYSVEEVVDDLKLVLDYLNEHFSGPIIVLGCSIGARLGLALAESDQRVKALICHTLLLSECPPDVWHQMGWNWVTFNALWMPQLQVDLRHFVDINALLEHNPMGEYIDQDNLLVWRYPMRTLGSLYSHRTSILKQPLGIPALILTGDRDEVIRPEYARTLVNIGPQPFDLVEIPDAGHMLPFDHIDESITACITWLKQYDLN